MPSNLFWQVARVATVAPTIATPLLAHAKGRHGGDHSGPGRHDAAGVDDIQRGRGQAQVEVRHPDQARVEVRHRNEPPAVNDNDLNDNFVHDVNDNDLNDNDVNDDRGLDAVDND